MDSIDFKIINFLSKNAKIPIAELSGQIGISGAAIHKRIKKLENKKIFTGSQINIDPKKVGFTTLAFIGIYLEKAIDVNFAIKKLKAIEEITECHYTTGDWSILVKIYCKDNQHLMKLLNEKIQAIKGVSRTETFISLNQQISRQIRI
ncbi:MAG: Lrp/AsnC family transcriptional regulator [Flavobacteriaceae bacterium]|tara:strand:+ start:14988 stop:15431 length:444 start_codon:yes stop_codon:yes gene_type:complete